jgi:hypothetical protein
MPNKGQRKKAALLQAEEQRMMQLQASKAAKSAKRAAKKSKQAQRTSQPDESTASDDERSERREAKRMKQQQEKAMAVTTAIEDKIDKSIGQWTAATSSTFFAEAVKLIRDLADSSPVMQRVMEMFPKGRMRAMQGDLSTAAPQSTEQYLAVLRGWRATMETPRAETEVLQDLYDLELRSLRTDDIVTFDSQFDEIAAELAAIDENYVAKEPVMYLSRLPVTIRSVINERYSRDGEREKLPKLLELQVKARAAMETESTRQQGRGTTPFFASKFKKGQRGANNGNSNNGNPSIPGGGAGGQPTSNGKDTNWRSGNQNGFQRDKVLKLKRIQNGYQGNLNKQQQGQGGQNKQQQGQGGLGNQQRGQGNQKNFKQGWRGNGQQGASGPGNKKGGHQQQHKEGNPAGGAGQSSAVITVRHMLRLWSLTMVVNWTVCSCGGAVENS